MYSKIKPFVILKNISYSDEKWKAVFDPEYDIKPYYYISNYGRIYSTARNGGCLIIPQQNDDGYLRISLQLSSGTPRYFQVHRLVMYTFAYIPGCEKLQVNHKDTCKTNNKLYNLEWCTCSYNIQHAVCNGVFGSMGENSKNSTISDNQVHAICKMWVDGYSGPEISNATGVNVSGVYDIVYGSRKYISSQYNIQPRLTHPLTEDQMHMICRYFQDTTNTHKTLKSYISEMLTKMNIEVNRKTISACVHLYNRDTHSDITINYDY